MAGIYIEATVLETADAARPRLDRGAKERREWRSGAGWNTRSISLSFPGYRSSDFSCSSSETSKGVPLLYFPPRERRPRRTVRRRREEKVQHAEGRKIYMEATGSAL